MKLVFYLLFISSFLALKAQNSQVFTKASAFYIRGNTSVIGNNSLSKDPQKSFDDSERVNDEFKMKYVDIDDYANTWSSSSAYLKIKPATKVKYAALYWTGTYHGERSLKRVKDDRVFHQVMEERVKDVRQIKFQTSYGGYHELLGTLIYDGENASNRSISTRAPYVCMVEVTDYIKDQESGYFTVANVSATQGEILGGSAAGWLLYVIYEDATEPLKYITTYHGFEFVNTEPVTIQFDDFQTNPKGEVQASVIIGALEGDSTLGRDQVGVYNPKNKTYVILDNKVRPSSNFFNSRIITANAAAPVRKPNSSNTLGFDIAEVKIPNSKNAVIANAARNVQLQYKSLSDRFFVFFTAFQTTIDDQWYANNKMKKTTFVKMTEPYTLVKENGLGTLESIHKNPKENVVKKPTSIIKSSHIESYNAPEPVNKALAQLLDKKAVSIPEMAPGYYLISNVFSDIANAKKWVETLKDRGLDAQLFYRQDKKMYYVFLAASTNAAQILKNLNMIKQQRDLRDSWILKVNLN